MCAILSPKSVSLNNFIVIIIIIIHKDLFIVYWRLKRRTCLHNYVGALRAVCRRRVVVVLVHRTRAARAHTHSCTQTHTHIQAHARARTCNDHKRHNMRAPATSQTLTAGRESAKQRARGAEWQATSKKTRTHAHTRTRSHTQHTGFFSALPVLSHSNGHRWNAYCSRVYSNRRRVTATAACMRGYSRQ